MADIMPKKFIDKININDWNQYSSNLDNLPYVKKYLANLLKKWVENIDNPLSIILVVELFKDELADVNRNLEEFERIMGVNNLNKLLGELESLKTKYSSEINKKISSLHGEMLVFKELTKKYKSIKKMESNGDWLCDKNTIVSVKSFLELDFNHYSIKNYLNSMFFIQRNHTLRDYNTIKLSNCENIDDSFRKKIIWFLESELITFLNFFNEQISHWNYFELKSTRYYYDNQRANNYLEIITNTHTKGNKGKDIVFLLKESRYGEPQFNHKIKIVFKNMGNHNKNYFDIYFDTNFYWEGCKIDLLTIMQKIQYQLEKIDKEYNRIRRQNINFIGWINIIVHPKHEKNIINNKKEIEQFIKKPIKRKDYKIHIAFCPQIGFDLKEPVIIVI
jgi:hypothetical protein